MSNNQENNEQQQSNPNPATPEKRKPKIQPVRRRDFIYTKEEADKVIKKRKR